MSDPAFGFLSMAYFTPLWLLVTGPVYLSFALVAIVVYRWGPRSMQRIGVPRQSVWALGAL